MDWQSFDFIAIIYGIIDVGSENDFFFLSTMETRTY